jgi:drug/metabolite transporter (DMT)-like permease
MNNTGRPLEIRERIKSDLFLLVAAAIWGGGFVAQRVASFHLGFFGFNGVRFLMAGIVLLPFVINRFGNLKKTLGWVILAGVILFAGSALQQAGVETTSAGSAGFITGVYVVLVPLFLAVFWKQRSSPITWVAALAALVGTYLLSTGGSSLEPSSGDLIVLAGSFVWALHVIIVGFAVQKMDVFAFSAGQFIICGLLHLGMSHFFEPVTLTALRSSWLVLVYAGLFSAAIGFTFQAIGQRKAPASDAALILSLEAVFAAIFGGIFLSEHMNWIQILGCGIILAAVLVAQLGVISRNKSGSSQVNTIS